MNLKIGNISLLALFLISFILSGCGGSNAETVEPTKEVIKSFSASGKYDVLCEDEECPQNSLSLVFTPDGGLVKGTGILGLSNGLVYLYEFKGYTKSDNTAFGSVDIELENEDFRDTLQWKAEFSDGAFIGFMVLPEDSMHKDDPMYSEFTLSY